MPQDEQNDNDPKCQVVSALEAQAVLYEKLACIESKVDRSNLTGDVALKEAEKLRREVHEIRTSLTGNGDPRKGLIFRFESLLSSIEQRRKWEWFILTALIGAVITSAFAIITVKL